VLSTLCLVGAYLVGAFPTAGLVGDRRGHDPAAEGSGNPGATNVYRLMGRSAALLVLLGDGGKGVLAALVGNAVAGRAGLFACGAAAVVGHCFPIGRWRRGGKGVATAAGVGAVAFPWIALAAAALWVGLAAVTRKASVASLIAITLVPVAAALTGEPGGEIAASVAISALVVLRHRANFGRLLRGQERSLG
jgi:acyl phosphate:glycerol-3-phosphate acyltransferase